MVVTSPTSANSALLPTPCTLISAMLSMEGKASESGLLPPTLLMEMPSTENCAMDCMPPWIEKLPLSSGCTPGNAAIRAYGLVLPFAPRTLPGSVVSASPSRLDSTVCVSVVITPDTQTVESSEEHTAELQSLRHL